MTATMEKATKTIVAAARREIELSLGKLDKTVHRARRLVLANLTASLMTPAAVVMAVESVLREQAHYSRSGFSEVAGVLDLPARTLALRKQTQRLAAPESDRFYRFNLYRFNRVLSHAERVLGTRTKATQ